MSQWMRAPDMQPRFPPVLAGACLAVMALVLSATRAQAQDAPPASGGGGIVIQENVSGRYFEWILTAAGAGIATFAVCRSSRRN